MYIPRLVDLSRLLKEKSYFLFGPRQTGKSSLVRETMPGTHLYNLLDNTVYLTLSHNPAHIRQELLPQDRLVVIDEIQRLPDLLNEVQLLIEEKGIRFLLTGSSARKLRRGGVNLLGGRLRTQTLHPLTRRELGERFHLTRALECGLLPSLYFSENPRADLLAYTGTYLQQEIVAEGATRNVPAFSRFLRVAAMCNGTVVNFTNVSSDAQVKRTTVYEYFEILKDTLILFELPAWRQTRKRKPLSSSKYYFFDVGVVRALQNRDYRPGTPEFGEGFETYLMHELSTYRDYHSHEPLSFWRSSSGYEVDFILGDHTAIEVKAKTSVGPQDLKALHALAEEQLLKRYFCVSLESRKRQVDGISLLPYQEFLDALWDGAYTA